MTPTEHPARRSPEFEALLHLMASIAILTHQLLLIYG